MSRIGRGVWVGVCCVCAAALAQPQGGELPSAASGSQGPAAQGPPAEQPVAQQPAAGEQQAELRQVRIADLPPAMRLGPRAETVRQAWPVVPVVVVVPDAVSYVEAIASWEPRGRFPVLIDDGTLQAREDIGRFVRGFEPRGVVRWKSVKEAAADRQGAIEQALFRVWSAQAPGEERALVVDSPAALLQRWKQLSITPPGVVLADAEDEAWPAALALAAGRTQPLVWATTDRGINGTMSLERFEELAKKVEEACAESGLSWREVGDELDAVTVCLNAPVKVQGPEGAPLALTDLLGRLDGEGGRVKGKRWAWAGQVFGNEAQAAYRAMSALFLMPKRAWLFDGYPSVEPWSVFDASKAAEHLRQAGLAVTVEDAPKQSSQHWRQTAAGPLKAGLVAVNTKGHADEFSLEPGRLRPGDVPILEVPAVVYFVHSFSAAAPAERSTIAGRWLERGAYAYAGSVHEPYLHGFVPTPIFAARVGASFAWGVGVRVDDGPAWKVAVMGDPLITYGPPAPRSQAELPLKGAIELEVELAEAVREKRFTEALQALVMLGRDADAAKLATAVRKDAADLFTEEVARAAVLPAFRAGDFETLVAAMAVLPAAAAAGELQDALWLAAWGRMGKLDEPALRVLEKHLREDQIGPDAAELARGFNVRLGRREAAGLINSVKEKARTEYDRMEIEDAMKRYGIRK